MSLLSRKTYRPAVSAAEVRAALVRVEDPELHLGLDHAGMLDEVVIDRSGRVRVTVRLTTPSCPLKESLTADVTAAAEAVAGVTGVDVVFTAMSESERRWLAALLRDARPPDTHPFGPGSATRVYAVASGKGGVGKSTLTANLAVALTEQGKRVGILDADVWGYSIPHLFGVRRAPVALHGTMLPVEAFGVALMSVGFFVREDEPVVWRGPMLHKAIEQFLRDVHWGELDVLLVDLPPGTGDVALSLLELVPDAALLAVTTPQPAARTVAERMGRMARDLRMPVAGVVENMSSLVCSSCQTSTPLFGAGGGEHLARAIGAPLLGQVPLDLDLRTAGDSGVPAVVAAPHARSVSQIRQIAAALPAPRRSLVGRPLPLSVP
ncbi:Mrp/NBP35 family ATP-binding protein [Rhodococcus rhodochrous]|uniref:Iron-sulfur cluster carrier protein n=1 Tax=Rhodococcus rhodochrous KG-21 TaxID=1441923 RepID=A0A0M9WMX2_RHORH|nr:Mrp/NBP35 family ATP-binding protein [Rhodococcus rhodochrous]KOS54941.1 sodium:proton antiporter [Rhodococcus rhodochrous KG-21]